MWRSLVAITSVVLSAAPVAAVDLYGVTDTTLYTVDPETGIATVVGEIDPPVAGLLGGLAWANGTLYGLSGTPGNAFFRVDTATGAVTEIGPIGIGSIFEGGLAYDGKDMWGVNHGAFGGDKNLISIDLDTGRGRFVGAIGDVDFNGLAMHDGELYGIERITNALWRIDRVNPSSSVRVGPGFGGGIDLGVKGGMAGAYAYADDSLNFFRVSFAAGTAEVLAATSVRFRALAPILCPADVNGDGAVDTEDLLAVLAAWGPCGTCPEDVDGNGAVDVADLLAVLAAWGDCP